MSKILVTGGTGFIGSHIVDRLIEKNFQVIVLDKSVGFRNLWGDSVTTYQIDLLDPQINDVFTKERPDYIIHLAAQISVSCSLADPIRDANVNILGTITLLKYAITYGVKKFIFASSAAVYGDPQYLPIDEEHPIQPTSFYGSSKAFAERYIQLYERLFKLEYCILRFANVYGPRQSPEGEAGVISIFMDQMISLRSLTIFGDGNQTRDFIFVKDVSEACVRALFLKKSHIINLGSGSQISLNYLVKTLREQFGEAVIKYKEPRSGDIMHSCLNNERARKLLDWKPKYELHRGLRETYKFLKMQKGV